MANNLIPKGSSDFSFLDAVGISASAVVSDLIARPFVGDDNIMSGLVKGLGGGLVGGLVGKLAGKKAGKIIGTGMVVAGAEDVVDVLAGRFLGTSKNNNSGRGEPVGGNDTNLSDSIGVPI